MKALDPLWLRLFRICGTRLAVISGNFSSTLPFAAQGTQRLSSVISTVALKEPSKFLVKGVTMGAKQVAHDAAQAAKAKLLAR